MILSLDSPNATLAQAGGKGAALSRLAAAGLPVPPGFHIATSAYRRFVEENQLAGAILAAAARARADDPASLEAASAEIRGLFQKCSISERIASAIRAEYSRMGGGDAPVAVRSSATAEDLPEMSFAGQQETFLNVRGGEALLAAVKDCWASLWTARALGYRLRQGIAPQDVALAVIVQELVPAEASGILFTANPITGSREQVVINAAWGLGEAVVGGQVTPDTYTLDKASGALETQEIADKTVMTGLAADGTLDQPVPEEKRRQAALQPEQLSELARLGAQIEQLFGFPVDVEWALAEGRLSILQARPITALPEPPARLDWTTPRAKGSYWRASVVELLPEPLSPLFATLGLPAWNYQMANLGKIAGLKTEKILPENILLTINDYAYYDYGFSARQSLQFVLLMPKMIRILLTTAQKRWEEQARPKYAALVESWAGQDLRSAPAARLLDGARELTMMAAEHYLTVQSGILPVAGMSEWAFRAAYDRFARRKGDPPALTFLLGLESTPIRAEKSLYDLALWAQARPELGAYLRSAPASAAASACETGPAPIADEAGWQGFCKRFAEHLERFGHTIYDLDFAKPIPADDPAPLLETLKHFLAGQARNPYERQSEAADRREQAETALLARWKGRRGRWMKRLMQWAQTYLTLREDGLADVGLGWPLLRRMLLELGRRLAAERALAAPNEVFWLKLDELEAAARALDAGQPAGDFISLVSQRRATWERERRVVPPVVLPLKGGGRFLGINWTAWMPARSEQAQGDTLRGIGASPGQVVGAARVIHGPEEFGQMQPGDILVAKITTPAWTTLFALASGVVTDVGGPLSHSSIVAREYHIPAVLGTGFATERIHSGQRIRVDGDQGVVTIEKD